MKVYSIQVMGRKRSRARFVITALIAVLLIAAYIGFVYGYPAYKEYKNYQWTNEYYAFEYLEGVRSILDVLSGRESEYLQTPIDLQAMIDDMQIVPPANPYRKDRKTVFTTIDKWVPGAIWYIPGPVESPDLYALGLFGEKQRSGKDVYTRGDNAWIIGWGLSKPDGIPDVITRPYTYGIEYFGDMKPVGNPSAKWKSEWGDSFYRWHYSDGTVLWSSDDTFKALFEEYFRRHPENFAAEKRPRMPNGFKITKEDAMRAGFDDYLLARIVEYYGVNPVIGGQEPGASGSGGK